MTVTLVPESLSQGDLVVVNSARVSFNNSHDIFHHEKDPKLLNYLARHNHWSPFGHAQHVFRMSLDPQQIENILYDGPAGLRVNRYEDRWIDDHTHFVSGSIYAFIQRLHMFNGAQQRGILHGLHRRYPLSTEKLYGNTFKKTLLEETDAVWSVPDEILVEAQLEHGVDLVKRHATATVHIKAPIYVARQLVKHQVDLVWNEISRRYVDYPLTFAQHPEWSKRPVNAKQGASGPVDCDTYIRAADLYGHVNSVSEISYQRLLDMGVAPEQARTVQTLASETEWYWTGTLDAFARVCRLRIHPDAQKETKVIAEGIEEALWEYWGEVWQHAY